MTAFSLSLFSFVEARTPVSDIRVLAPTPFGPFLREIPPHGLDFLASLVRLTVLLAGLRRHL